MITLLNRISYFCLFFILINNLVSFSCSERSKVASVKSNMHTLQTMVETYAVNWAGSYPKNITQLKKDAIKNNYWKPLKNPWNKKDSVILTDYINEQNSDFNFVEEKNYSEGTLLYTPLANRETKDITGYKIYGVTKIGYPYFSISSFINDFLNFIDIFSYLAPCGKIDTVYISSAQVNDLVREKEKIYYLSNQ